MKLADALAALPPRLPNGPRCTVGAILDKLDDDDRAALTAALDDDEVQGSGLARLLSSRGHKVNGNTIQRHRRGDCSCG